MTKTAAGVAVSDLAVLPCLDCGTAPAVSGSLCIACSELSCLLQARAILAGENIAVRRDHLIALERCIRAQADAIVELQRAVRSALSLTTARARVQ